MSYFYSFDAKSSEGRRTASRLIALRDHLDSRVPKRTLDETLLLATWNIREFDSNAYGHRTSESIAYIAEIISHFDIVAIQEVRTNLDALMRVKERLGTWWKVVFSDVTEGERGNDERLAFLYDSRKVEFSGLAGEIVLPASDGAPARQLARTPYLVGFRAGWFRFNLCTVHIYWGEGKAEHPERRREIRRLVEFLAERDGTEGVWSNNTILLGDFNIFKPSNDTFQEILDAGFIVPDALQKLPSNIAKNKRHYDQIAFRHTSSLKPTGADKCGVINFFDVVYRDDDEDIYIPAMGEGYTTKSDGKPRDPAKYSAHYRRWRTYQMSDHCVMWTELKIDFGREYLERVSGRRSS